MALEMESSTCNCKIGECIRVYGVENLNTNVIRLRETEDASLRDLEGYINKHILEAAIDDAPDAILDADSEFFGAMTNDEALDHIYTALADDAVSSERKARVRTQLEHAGIDVAEIEDHWITHMTVKSHLNQCLEIDTSRTTEITLQEAQQTIEWAKTRCKGIIERVINQLQSNELLHLRSTDVSLAVRVTCTDCNTTFRISELSEKQRCACHTQSTTSSSDISEDDI